MTRSTVAAYPLRPAVAAIQRWPMPNFAGNTMSRHGKIALLLRASLDASDPHGRVVAVAKGSRPEELIGLGKAARFHGVSGYVHAAIADVPNVPARERDHLNATRSGTVLSHLRTMMDLAYLERVLGDSTIPWLVLKGPTLAEPVHGAVELRACGDLDILVPGRYLAEAMQILEAHGAKVVDRNWTLIHAERKGEVHLQLPSGTSLDLHWHLYNEPDRRTLFPVSIDALFERRTTVMVTDRTIPALSTTDAIVYVAAHMLHSGADRLVWIKDVERLLAQDDCDPVAVAERAREWQADLVLGSALHRVEQVLGSPRHVAAVRTALGRHHRWWLMISRWTWRMSPAEQARGSGSLGRIVARSTRGSTWTSFAELVMRGFANLRDRRSGEAPKSGIYHADDPRSDRYESGGPRERHAFLDQVTSESR